MSKIEMAKRSANERAAPLTERAKSTAEAQMLLIQRLDRLAEDQARLTEEQMTAARQMAGGMNATAKKAAGAIHSAQQEAEKSLSQITSTLIRAESSLTAVEKAAKTAAGQAVKASRQVETQANRLRWTVIVMAAVFGLTIGILSLIALLIWQPGLIQQLWTIAQAIR
jgi:septation ring formation regulator EzrA